MEGVILPTQKATPAKEIVVPVPDLTVQSAAEKVSHAILLVSKGTEPSPEKIREGARALLNPKTRDGQVAPPIVFRGVDMKYLSKITSYMVRESEGAGVGKDDRTDWSKYLRKANNPAVTLSQFLAESPAQIAAEYRLWLKLQAQDDEYGDFTVLD